MIATARRVGTTRVIHRAMAETIRATILARRCRQRHRARPVHRDRHFPNRSSAPRSMADRGIRIATTGGGHAMAATDTTPTISDGWRRAFRARRFRSNPIADMELKVRQSRLAAMVVVMACAMPLSGCGYFGSAVGWDDGHATEQQRPSRLPLSPQPSIDCVRDRTPSPTCFPAAPSRMSAWK